MTKFKIIILSSSLLLLLVLPLVSTVYPEYCHQKEDCEIDQVCTENKCICDLSQDFQYDELLDLCVKLSGAKCGSDYNTGSSDNEDNEDDYTFDCVENAKCDLGTKTCTCQSGYTVTSSRECKRSFGAPCDDLDLCNYSGFLVCDKNRSVCDCTNPQRMIYDPSVTSCVSNLGEECEFIEWMGFKKNCIQNAHCVRPTDNPEDFSGVCRCQDGFSNKSLSFCGKLYGESCQSHSDCFTGFCHNSDKTCACSVKSVFDSNLNICRVKVGDHCAKDQACVENAYCDLIVRQCLCPSSKFSIVDGHCIVRTTMTPQKQVNSSTVTAQLYNSPDEGNRIFQPMSILVFIMLAVLGIYNNHHYLYYN